MMTGEFAALLVTLTLPPMVPDRGEENVTSSVACCPGARIKPEDNPLAANFPPATLIWAMVTLAFPAFIRSTLSVFAVPAETFPKFKLGVLASRSVRALTPVPLTITVLGALEALLITETVPVMAPTVLGENTMFSVDCWPGAMVMGSAVPGIVNPFASVLACVTLIFEAVVLETVTDSETVPPTATVPNVTAVGDTEMDAPEAGFSGFEVFVALVTPTQPDIEMMPHSKGSNKARLVNAAKAKATMRNHM